MHPTCYYYLEVRAELTVRGQYGHLGAYAREINVTDLILARRATETEITSCSMRVNSTIIMMSDSQ